ncbi:Zn-dependent hydrolase [Halotalea alkalilenta]|uniref:Zn-dependent hydrolase n=1 Tax=Halotalea alkalilenta TaxID=376489 RepID=UPI0004840A9A|nr:Zn-dependent hydrolase [Halotalea alkalilenta]
MWQASPPSDPRLLAERLFGALAEIGCDPPGITRDAYGDGEQRAFETIASAAQSLGGSIERDAAANLYCRFAGASPALPMWVSGSHLDSVPHGGNFDGAAGVIAPLCALAKLAAEGRRPLRDVVVAAFRAEESTWFPLSYPGSRAAFGMLDAEALRLTRADSGRSLADHLRDCGGDPERVAAGEAWLDPARLHGFIELHIEQGPLLEHLGVPLGVVSGISGSFRYRRARLLGAHGHSGAVPRELRQDTVFAFAALVGELDALWSDLERRGERATITCGQVHTDPTVDAFSKIPGELGFCLDVRSEREETLAEIEQALAAMLARIERERGVRAELGERTSSRAARMDPTLRRLLREAAERAGLAPPTLPSGAGHDAATFSHQGVPSAMLFVRNQHGSHNPFEAMELDDFFDASAVLAEVLAQ